MNERSTAILDEETKNLRSALEKAGQNGEKTIRFPVKKEMVDVLSDTKDAVRRNRDDIPDAQRNKFGNMLDNVFGVIGDAMEGVDDWWNKPVRNTADGKPQTRGEKWSRRLSKGFDATVDFASEAIGKIAKSFEDNQIEEMFIEIPLLLGKQVLKGLDWLNEWIKGWDLDPKDKEQSQEKGNITKNLSQSAQTDVSTGNIPSPKGGMNNSETKNIPTSKRENISMVSKPKVLQQETRNLPLSKLLERNSR